MNKQDLITKINNSSISDLRKSQILELINNNEVDVEIMDQIKSIIQEDIDENVNEILSDDQKKELLNIENDSAIEIKKIITDVADDVKFVEDQLVDLDNMVQSISPTLEEIQIENVKSNLDKVSE